MRPYRELTATRTITLNISTCAALRAATAVLPILLPARILSITLFPRSRVCPAPLTDGGGGRQAVHSIRSGGCLSGARARRQ